jgi:anti-anti-sigma regulatory factor
MTTVLRERAVAPADPADRSAAPAVRPHLSPATASPSAEPVRAPALGQPVAADSSARPAPLVRLGPDRAVLVATGVLDGPGVARLAGQLVDAAHRGAVQLDLDLSRVTHVDGQGARALLGQSYRLEDGGGLRLLDAPPQVRRALRFYGAGHLLRR